MKFAEGFHRHLQEEDCSRDWRCEICNDHLKRPESFHMDLLPRRSRKSVCEVDLHGGHAHEDTAGLYGFVFGVDSQQFAYTYVAPSARIDFVKHRSREAPFRVLRSEIYTCANYAIGKEDMTETDTFLLI